MLKGKEAYARYDPFRIMVDMGRKGPWRAQDKDAPGGVEVQERRAPAVSRGTAGAARNGRPEGPGRTQGRTGWRQAIGLLGSLDGKTLEHAKTTWAESGVR
jgi:hypothetical protein